MKGDEALTRDQDRVKARAKEDLFITEPRMKWTRVNMVKKM